MSRDLVLGLVLGALVPGVVRAWPGDLDPTFGRGGKVVTDLGGSALGRAGLIEPDGRIVVAGLAYLQELPGPLGPPLIGLARYLPDGTLDPTFGNGGTVTSDALSFGAYAIVRQSDGKLIVAGSAVDEAGSSGFGLARFDSDGTLDPTFGTAGVVSTDFAGGDDDTRAVTLQADGKIVGAGFAGVGADSFFAVARYNPDGTLDPSFGAGGKTTTALRGIAVAVVVQPDGRIVLGGTAGGFALVRYDAAGALDPSFGSGGVVVTAALGVLTSLVRQPDGEFVAAGGGDVATGTGAGSLFALARYDVDGNLDATFGTAGVARTRFDTEGPESADAAGLVLLPDGKLVAVGTDDTLLNTSFGHYSQFALVRYGPDGGLDASFAPCGAVETPFGRAFSGADAVAQAALLQADGKVVAVGSAERVTHDSSFALARYGGGPASACAPAASGRGGLTLKNLLDDDRDMLRFKWVGAGAVDRADFGDPTTTSDYGFCIVDGTGMRAFRMTATAPAGGDWQATTRGYNDRNRYREPEGLSPVKLAAGLAGRARIEFHGRGRNLLMPPLPLPAPVTVRIERSDGPQCWQATFSTPRTNTEREFAASSD